MKEIKALLRRYRIWEHHLEKVANEIGENELLYRPMPESNSAAWILVHLIQNYRDFLELVKDEALADMPHPSEEELAEMPFSQVFVLLQEYRAEFFRQVDVLGEKEQLDVAAPAGEDKSWRDLIHSIVSHEIYHCGQLAYIARILQQRTNHEN